MKASANQADRLSHAQVLIKRVTVATLRGPKTGPRFFNFSVAIAITAMVVLGVVYSLGFKAALLIGLVAGLVIMITGLALDRRWVNQNAQSHEEPDVTDLPTAMPPADSEPGEIKVFVPVGETEVALRSLVFMAQTPSQALKNVSRVIVATRRRPNGIQYSVKNFQSNNECMSILSLYVPESDALGCRYHAKLRQDLIHGAQRTLDVKLEYADGSVTELKNLSVYKSA